MRHELKRYQEQYPPLDIETDLSSEDTKKAIGSLKSSVFLEEVKPLLRAYDDRMIKIEKENSKLNSENTSLKAQVKSLELEAARLRNENAKQPDINSEDHADLIDRARILTDENDKLMAEHRKLINEISYLRANVQDRDSSAEGIAKQISEANEKVIQAEQEVRAVYEWKREAEDIIKSKGSDLLVLTEENSQLKHEVKAMRKQLSKEKEKRVVLEQSVEEITAAYKNGLTDMNNFTRKEADLNEEIKGLQLQCDELAAALSDATREAAVLTDENQALSQTLLKLESQLKQKDDQDIKRYQEQEELKQSVADAHLERDKVLLQLENKNQEIKRLDERLQKTLRRHQDQFKAEKQMLQDHFALERRQLLEEINSISIKCANASVQMERAVREKKAIEGELERLNNRYPTEIERLESVQIELNERLLRQNRDREDALLKLENYQESMAREMNKFEAEKKSLAHEANLLSNRLSKAEKEVEISRQDKLRSFQKLTELESQLSLINKQMEEEKMKLSTEVHELKSKHEKELSEYRYELNFLTALNEKQKAEIQDILVNQQKMSLSWKDEAHVTKKKYESVINEIQEQLKQTTKKLEDAQTVIARLSLLKDDLQTQIEKEKKAHGNMHSLVKEAEAKAASAIAQVKVLLRRESDLISQLSQLRKFLSEFN